MKSNTSFLLLAALISISACKQKEKTIEQPVKSIAITDMRPGKQENGTSSLITPTKEGEIYVNHILTEGHGLNEHDGKLDLYDIHFIGKYKGELNDYNMMINDTVYYDRASYKWFGDTVVSVRLDNAATKKHAGPINMSFGRIETRFVEGKYEW